MTQGRGRNVPGPHLQKLRAARKRRENEPQQAEAAGKVVVNPLNQREPSTALGEAPVSVREDQGIGWPAQGLRDMARASWVPRRTPVVDRYHRLMDEARAGNRDLNSVLTFAEKHIVEIAAAAGNDDKYCIWDFLS